MSCHILLLRMIQWTASQYAAVAADRHISNMISFLPTETDPVKLAGETIPEGEKGPQEPPTIAGAISL